MYIYMNQVRPDNVKALHVRAMSLVKLGSFVAAGSVCIVCVVCEGVFACVCESVCVST